MRYQALAIGLTAASPVLAEEIPLKCGNQYDFAPPVNLASKVRGLEARQNFPALPLVNLTVHVVAMSNKREDGYLSAAEVNTQIDLLKKVYKEQLGITFNHTTAHNRWVVNKDWGGPQVGDNAQYFWPMKEALHVGDYRNLNIYFRHIPDYTDFGGHGSNPQYEAWKNIPIRDRTLRDGAVISDFTLPGSTHKWMNKGHTALHEVGHWFGLYHPFQDDQTRRDNQNPDPCHPLDPDDHVTDTPKMQATAGMSGTCNENADTCPNAPGKDPIHNFMAYSIDSCLTEFTAGQAARVRMIWATYRANATSNTWRD